MIDKFTTFVYENAVTIAVVGATAAVFVATTGGYWWGRLHQKRMLRAAVRRRIDGKSESVADLVLQPAEDGAMDLFLSRKMAKDLRNGGVKETMLVGAKQAMLFRIRCL